MRDEPDAPRPPPNAEDAISAAAGGAVAALIVHSLRAQREGARSPYGWAGFVMLLVVVGLHLVVPLDPGEPWLFSPHPSIEWGGISVLVAGPILAVWLAVRHWVLTGRPFLSLVTLAGGGFLALATLAAVLLAAVVG